MSDRYFIDEPIAAGRVVLAGPEAHHLIHVMRAAPGQRVTLFDGSGDEFPAVVERIGRAEVELAVLSREHADRELPFELTLGVALPKGERQRWLVEKAVELGVTRIVPLRTCRAVAQPGEQALARLRRAVVEASKQCGRNRLLRIDGPQAWPDFVAATAGQPCRCCPSGTKPRPAVRRRAGGSRCRLLELPSPTFRRDRRSRLCPRRRRSRGDWAGGGLCRRRGGAGYRRRLAGRRSRPANPPRRDRRPAAGGDGRRSPGTLKKPPGRML